MMQHVVLAMAAVLAMALSARPVQAAQAAEPADAQWVLTLHNALPEDKSMEVYLDLHGGAVQGAFANGPTFNKAVYRVDAAGVKVDGSGHLTGRVAIQVPFDGYVPRDGKDLSATYMLDTKPSGGNFTGTCGGQARQGAITAALAPRVSAAGPLHVSLDVDNALAASPDKPGRRARMTFGIRDGKAFGAELWPPGSIVDTSFSAVVDACEVTLKDGVLSGQIKARVTPQGQEKPVACVYSLEGRAIGPMAAGAVTITRDGQKVQGGGFAGKLTDAPPPAAGEAQYTVVLHGGVSDGTYVQMYLRAHEGKITQAFAATPDWNNGTHEVDTSGLTLAGDVLKGTVNVTVHPDPWSPKDHKIVQARYELDGQVKDYEVVGNFTGTFGGSAVKGPMGGEIQPPVKVADPQRVTVKIEDGLTGGNAWQNRAFLHTELSGGKVTGGKLSNNHTKLNGTVDTGTLSWGEKEVTGTLDITAGPGGNVDEGKYTVTIKAVPVGTIAAGQFETRRDGKIVKTGRCWAAAESPRKGGK